MRKLRTTVTLALSAALFAAIGCSGSTTAPDAVSAFTISLANNGTQAFLTPFPDIQIQGASVLPVATPAGNGKFSYDLTVHVVPPNPNSVVTGTVTFDFGAAGSFSATVTGDAISGPPTDIAGVRTTVTTHVMEYAVARDGRFLVELEAAPPTSPPITIVLNWMTNLRP